MVYCSTLWSALSGIPATAKAVRAPADSPNLERATEENSVAFFVMFYFERVSTKTQQKTTAPMDKSTFSILFIMQKGKPNA